MLVVRLVSAVAMNFSVIIPPLAGGRPYTLDAAGYGFLMAASGVGSLLAAISLAVRRPRESITDRHHRGPVIVRIGGESSENAPACSRSPCCTVMIAVGWGAILMAATANDGLELVVPTLACAGAY